MKLITKAIEKQLEKNPLYSGEDIPLEDKKILVKFFTPWSNWTWFVTEAERLEDDDWRFFGLVHGFEKEWGYFMFSELKSIVGPAGLRIERDAYGPPKFIREVL